MAIKVEKTEGDKKIVDIKSAGLSAEAKAEVALAKTLSAKVKKSYEALGKAMEGVMQKAYVLGEDLVALKAAIGHGGFQKKCEEDLGLNYKMCQRAMDVVTYKEKLVELPAPPETLTEALSLTKKWKQEEKDQLAAQEGMMFASYYEADMEYKEKTAGLETAAEVTAVPKPVKPWKDYEANDYQNTENHYKKWLKAGDEPTVDPKAAEKASKVETELTVDEIVERAFVDGMKVIDRYLTGDEKAEALDGLIDLLQEERGNI